jgi:Methyltransferase FkbM domain
MEGGSSNTPVVKYLTEIGAVLNFTLVDIGCSGGISPVWGQFGAALRAWGFDPDVQDVERLRQAETRDGVTYVAAYAGLDESHPFRTKRGAGDPWGRNPWGRLSVAYAHEVLRNRALTDAQRTEANMWSDVELAPESQTVVVPEHLVANGVTSVDFLKIDVDGVDLEVLYSFDAALESLQITGASLEVNFFGSESETDNTLHNTDRFMKAHGFELFDLTLRRYSVAALPSPFVSHVPSPTVSGRILQGDAVYFRDLGSDEHAGLAQTLAPGKLLNLICALAVCNLPDCAAELAIRFEDSISKLCSVARVLDLLAAQAQEEQGVKLSYAELLSRFDDQDPMFFNASRFR